MEDEKFKKLMDAIILNQSHLLAQKKMLISIYNSINNFQPEETEKFYDSDQLRHLKDIQDAFEFHYNKNDSPL